MEAALMQAYPGRRPIRELVQGRISVRELRVMVEHLPPWSPVHRVIHGPWTDREALLWDVSARLRDLLSLTHNVHRGQNTAAVSLPYLPVPEPTIYQRQAQDSGSEAERRDLLRVLNRPRR